MYGEVAMQYRRQMEEKVKEKFIFIILGLHPAEISLHTCYCPSGRFSPTKVEL